MVIIVALASCLALATFGVTWSNWHRMADWRGRIKLVNGYRSVRRIFLCKMVIGIDEMSIARLPSEVHRLIDERRERTLRVQRTTRLRNQRKTRLAQHRVLDTSLQAYRVS